MQLLRSSPLRAFGLALLAGGLLAGSLAGCAARRRAEAAETQAAATAAVAVSTGAASSTSAATAASSSPEAGVTPPANQIDAQLQKLTDELNSADTITDFSTAVPADAATASTAAAADTPQANTPAPGAPTKAPTVAPKATAAPTSGGISSSEEEAQLDQEIGAMLDQLNKTDTVPEAAGVK
jgi:hypothetical protein